MGTVVRTRSELLLLTPPPAGERWAAVLADPDETGMAKAGEERLEQDEAMLLVHIDRADDLLCARMLGERRAVVGRRGWGESFCASSPAAVACPTRPNGGGRSRSCLLGGPP